VRSASFGGLQPHGSEEAILPGAVAQVPNAGTDPRGSWQSFLASSGLLKTAAPQRSPGARLPARADIPVSRTSSGRNPETDKIATTAKDLPCSHVPNALKQSRSDSNRPHAAQAIPHQQPETRSSLLADFVSTAPSTPQPATPKGSSVLQQQRSAASIGADLPVPNTERTLSATRAAVQQSMSIKPASSSPLASEKQSSPLAVSNRVDPAVEPSRAPVGQGADSVDDTVLTEAGSRSLSGPGQSHSSAIRPALQPATNSPNVSETLPAAATATEASSAIAPQARANPESKSTALPSAPRSEAVSATSSVAGVSSRERSSATRTASTPTISSPTTSAHVAGQNSDSTLVREALASQTTANSLRTLNSGAGASATSPASSETFEALDASTGAIAPAWIHAGAHTAEAGYQDPRFGWVGVRAQSDVEGIHVTLVPGSADAAQSIGGHLAGLNSYLTAHHTPVQSLTLDAREALSAPAGDGRQGSQNPGQGTSQHGESQTEGAARLQIPGSAQPGTTQSAADSGESPGGLASLSTAGHSISVMA